MASELPPLPPGWTEHTAPTGHKYYWNATLKKSTYKRPTLESTPPVPTPPAAPPVAQPEIKNTALQITKPEAVPITEWSQDMSVQRENETEERQTARMMTDVMWKKLEDRPRKKIAIPGAEPWVQVTTKWRRNFYYNPETNESFWKIPAHIRPIVERWQIESARAEAAVPEESEEESEDDYSEDENPDGEEAPVEFTEEDIAYQLALMQEEYGQPAGEQIHQEEGEEELDWNAKRQIFISLLEDKDVNPFNTWDHEMPKMVQDPRYGMLKNTKQRMEIFDEWARARIALIKEEKAQEEKEDPKVAYLRLLEQKGDSKEYWFEFKRKFRKEPEYKHFGTEKLREDLWRDWVARKKMSTEKREAELLQWMRGLKGTSEEVMQKVKSDVRYWVLGSEKDDIVRDALRGR